jgi:pheromone shutdown protein TraB
VERAITTLRPDAVVIELCRSRTGLLYADDAPASDRASNPFGLSGEGGPLAVLRRSLELGGWAPLFLRVLLVRLSARLSASLPASANSHVRAVPGADFRAARYAATAVDATLVLGDRPVEITLERAWRALGWRDRGRVLGAAWAVLGGGGASAPSSSGASADTHEERASADALLEKALEEEGSEVIEALEGTLAQRFPTLLEPLIAERDVFLSLTLKSSLAVSGKQRVLGVVGRGHVDGVVRALGEDHEGRYKALTWTPSRAAAKQKILGVPRPLATRLATDGLIAAACLLAWSSSDGASAVVPPEIAFSVPWWEEPGCTELAAAIQACDRA